MSSAVEKKGSFGKWLPGVLISLVLIILFLFLVDWQEFQQALITIPFFVILAVVLLTILALITRSFAWRNLLDGQISFRDAYFGENIGYLTNNFLPLRLGEIARGILVADKVEGGFTAVIPSIFLERLIDLGFAAFTLLIAIPFVVSERWMIPSVFVALMIVVIGGVFLYLSMKKAEVLEKILHKVFRRFPKIDESILVLFRKFIQGLQLALKGKNAIQAVFFLGLTWGLYWITYYVLIRAIAPEATFIWALFTDGVVSLGIAIPSAPGSLGVWEASFVAALAVFGVEQAKSLAIGLVLHLVNYAVTGLFGIIGLGIFGASLNELLQRVRTQRNSSKTSFSGES